MLLHSTGVRSGSARRARRGAARRAVDPSRYYFRTSCGMETSEPALAPLQDVLFIAAAVREADQVTYTAYRVT